MGRIKEILQTELDGVFVYSVAIGNTEEDDRRSSFFDKIDRQVEEGAQK